MAAPKRWAIQQIFTQTYKDVANTKVYATLDDLKTCSVENAQETVYSSGGVGNAYITAHSHSKRTTGSATAATMKNDIMALVTGTPVATGSTTVPVNGEILTVSTNTATTLHTAVGTLGSEIKGLFLYNADGTFGTEFEQAGTVAAGKFTYTVGTKLLTFNTAEIADDTQIIVFYEAASDATTQTISNDTSTFSAIVRIEMQTLVQDACTGDEYAATLIIYKAKLTGAWSFEVAADGEPATLDVSFEALKAGCTNSKLWDLIVHDTLT